MFDLNEYARVRNYIMARFADDRVLRIAYGAGLRDAIAIALIIGDADNKAKMEKSDTSKAIQEGMKRLAMIITHFADYVGSPSDVTFGINPKTWKMDQETLDLLDEKVWSVLYARKKP